MSLNALFTLSTVVSELSAASLFVTIVLSCAQVRIKLQQQLADLGPVEEALKVRMYVHITDAHMTR